MTLRATLLSSVFDTMSWGDTVDQLRHTNDNCLARGFMVVPPWAWRVMKGTSR